MMKLLTNEHLFWDSDAKLIDPQIHQQSIIERVLERGSWAEIKELIEFYGKEEIVTTAKKARWFSDKTTHFISGYFQIPLEQMRCFKEKQLNPIHYL
jgi:hypothetical protein